jgi:hypothetical protein
MYILWWIIAFLIACAFFTLEWKLWRAGIERVYGKQRVALPGRRWYYTTVAFAIGFFGFMAVMLGLLNYADIRFQNLQDTICWLVGAFIVGGVNLVSVGARLKYFDFDDG